MDKFINRTMHSMFVCGLCVSLSLSPCSLSLSFSLSLPEGGGGLSLSALYLFLVFHPLAFRMSAIGVSYSKQRKITRIVKSTCDKILLIPIKPVSSQYPLVRPEKLHNLPSCGQYPPKAHTK